MRALLSIIVVALGACGSAHADNAPPGLPLPPCAAGLQRDAHGQCVGWLPAPTLTTTRRGMALTLDDNFQEFYNLGRTTV